MPWPRLVEGRWTAGPDVASFNARVPLVAALTKSGRRQLALSIDIRHSTAELNRMKLIQSEVGGGRPFI